MSDENPFAPPESDVTVDQSGELASRGVRFGGAMIDGLVALVIMLPAMYLFGYWDRAMLGQQTTMDTALFGALGFVVFVGVQGYLLANHGQTIGKRILGTRIVSIDDDSILPFWKVITYRYLPIQVLNMIPGIGVIFGLVDSLAIFREDRRCIHDLIAGTKVIVATKS